MPNNKTINPHFDHDRAIWKDEYSELYEPADYSEQFDCYDLQPYAHPKLKDQKTNLKNASNMARARKIPDFKNFPMNGRYYDRE